MPKKTISLTQGLRGGNHPGANPLSIPEGGVAELQNMIMKNGSLVPLGVWMKSGGFGSTDHADPDRPWESEFLDWTLGPSGESSRIVPGDTLPALHGLQTKWVGGGSNFFTWTSDYYGVQKGPKSSIGQQETRYYAAILPTFDGEITEVVPEDFGESIIPNFDIDMLQFDGLFSYKLMICGRAITQQSSRDTAWEPVNGNLVPYWPGCIPNAGDVEGPNDLSDSSPVISFKPDIKDSLGMNAFAHFAVNGVARFSYGTISPGLRKGFKDQFGDSEYTTGAFSDQMEYSHQIGREKQNRKWAGPVLKYINGVTSPPDDYDEGFDNSGYIKKASTALWDARVEQAQITPQYLDEPTVHDGKAENITLADYEDGALYPGTAIMSNYPCSATMALHNDFTFQPHSHWTSMFMVEVVETVAEEATVGDEIATWPNCNETDGRLQFWISHIYEEVGGTPTEYQESKMVKLSTKEIEDSINIETGNHAISWAFMTRLAYDPDNIYSLAYASIREYGKDPYYTYQNISSNFRGGSPHMDPDNNYGGTSLIRNRGYRIYWSHTGKFPTERFFFAEINWEKGYRTADSAGHTLFGTYTGEMWYVNNQQYPPTSAYQNGTNMGVTLIASQGQGEFCENAVGYDDRSGDLSFIKTIEAPMLSEFSMSKGYSHDSTTDCVWDVAVTLNQRVYLANYIQNGKFYGDRILFSPARQYDIYPEDNFFEVASDDGDKIVNMEAFGDRLMVFKHNTVEVINVGGKAPSLEATFKNTGIPNKNCTAVTRYGVVWCNKNGAWMFDGQRMIDLFVDRETGQMSMNKVRWHLSMMDMYNMANRMSGGGLVANYSDAMQEQAGLTDSVVYPLNVDMLGGPNAEMGMGIVNCSNTDSLLFVSKFIKIDATTSMSISDYEEIIEQDGNSSIFQPYFFHYNITEGSWAESTFDGHNMQNGEQFNARCNWTPMVETASESGDGTPIYWSPNQGNGNLRWGVSDSYCWISNPVYDEFGPLIGMGTSDNKVFFYRWLDDITKPVLGGYQFDQGGNFNNFTFGSDYTENIRFHTQNYFGYGHKFRVVTGMSDLGTPGQSKLISDVHITYSVIGNSLVDTMNTHISAQAVLSDGKGGAGSGGKVITLCDGLEHYRYGWLGASYVQSWFEPLAEGETNTWNLTGMEDFEGSGQVDSLLTPMDFHSHLAGFNIPAGISVKDSALTYNLWSGGPLISPEEASELDIYEDAWYIDLSYGDKEMVTTSFPLNASAEAIQIIIRSTPLDKIQATEFDTSILSSLSDNVVNPVTGELDTQTWFGSSVQDLFQGKIENAFSNNAPNSICSTPIQIHDISVTFRSSFAGSHIPKQHKAIENKIKNEVNLS